MLDEVPAIVRHTIFVNPRSGTGDGDDLVRRALDELPDAELVTVDADVDIGAEVRRAVASGRVVVAAGGDGTINAVVQHLEEGVLGVLPCGTRNHFARDLGVIDPEVALATLRDGNVATIDAGRVGDRLFVNNVGLGLYPELVRDRERHERSLGKLAATIRAAWTVLLRAEPVCGTVVMDGEKQPLSAWVVFVGNNCFGTERGRLTRRQRLDEGVLDVRLLAAKRGPLSRLRGAARATSGRAWSGKRLQTVKASEVRFLLGGHPMPVAADGEAGDPVEQADVEIVPGSLRVMTPRESGGG